MTPIFRHGDPVKAYHKPTPPIPHPTNWRHLIRDESAQIIWDVALIHDRDGKYSPAFDHLIETTEVEAGPNRTIKALNLPARSPDLNSFAERWGRSIKEECLDRMIPFGEKSVWRMVLEYIDHFHAERNHQGKGNELLFPKHPPDQSSGRGVYVRRKSRLGGVLNFYYRRAG